MNLARKIENYLGENTIVCVEDDDVRNINEELAIRVFGQKYSKEIVKGGAFGTLLNHSDFPVSIREIKRVLQESAKSGFEVILCGKNLKEIRKFLELKEKPFAIAFEAEELIGTGKSVTSYRGEDVRKFSEMLSGSGIMPLCGAGISNVGDFKEALRLGCNGVLIASAIAKVKSPEGFLRKLKELR